MERSYFHSALEYFQTIYRLSQAYDPEPVELREAKKLPAHRQGRLERPRKTLSTATDHSRSRSRQPLTAEIRQQCPNLQHWMKDCLGASDSHLCVFEALETNAEKWIYYLVVYEKALYRQHGEEIKARWARFETSNVGNCEWGECIQAMLSLVHAHTLQTLIILPDIDLWALIWKKDTFGVL